MKKTAVLSSEKFSIVIILPISEFVTSNNVARVQMKGIISYMWLEI